VHRLVLALFVFVPFGWQAGAFAAPESLASPWSFNPTGDLVETTAYGPAAMQDAALTQRLVPVRQAEIDTLVELAARHESGRGPGADPARAFGYYQAAALRGDGFAQEQVARCYETGLGVERDIEQALRWYELAAHRDYPGAQLALVRLLGADNAIAPRPEQAYAWLLVVLANPATPRDLLRDVQVLQRSLERRLHPAQIDTARNRARRWSTAGQGLE